MLLKGIDRVRDTLMENTERFAKQLPANNALLWGARGMGKSSLVKAARITETKVSGSDLTSTVPGWKTPQWSAGRRRASQRHAAPLLRGAKTKT